MSYRNSNYAAFYVADDFNTSNLGANQAPDFCYYNLLRAWKGDDSSFPFIDAHAKTYNVRDDSKWETLQKRLHERLDSSKNIILFLSKNTQASRALNEEINYGVNVKGLPVIVVYPDFTKCEDIAYSNDIRQPVKNLWNKLPIFKTNMLKVATLHIPMDKSTIRKALSLDTFTVQNMCKANTYFYK